MQSFNQLRTKAYGQRHPQYRAYTTVPTYSFSTSLVLRPRMEPVNPALNQPLNQPRKRARDNTPEVPIYDVKGKVKEQAEERDEPEGERQQVRFRAASAAEEWFDLCQCQGCREARRRHVVRGRPQEDRPMGLIKKDYYPEFDTEVKLRKRAEAEVRKVKEAGFARAAAEAYEKKRVREETQRKREEAGRRQTREEEARRKRQKERRARERRRGDGGYLSSWETGTPVKAMDDGRETRRYYEDLEDAEGWAKTAGKFNIVFKKRTTSTR